MALSAKVVDFVRLYFRQYPREIGTVREVAIMQIQARVGVVGILIDMIDALRIEKRGAALDYSATI